MGSRVWRQAETKKEKEKEKENIMTQYTIGKDGKVKSKGGGKKPIELFPITKKIKSMLKKKKKPKQPKKVWT